MLTYENFTSPRNLFKLLIRRYFMEPPAGCEGADREEWTKSVQVCDSDTHTPDARFFSLLTFGGL
jgi:hypothetical protein